MTKAFAGWMWSRKLVIPAAVFVAAYALGMHELPHIEKSLGIAGPLQSHSEFLTPIIAAGIAGAFLSAIFEVPRRWWDEEIFSSRLGLLYRGASFLLVPMAIRATEIVAIQRPWERDTDRMPLSTAFLIPTFVSAITASLTMGYSNWKLEEFKNRAEISPFTHLVLTSIITLFGEVGRIMYLTGQSSLPGLAVQAAVFFLASVPLATRDLMGRNLYEQLTAYKAWHKNDPSKIQMSKAKRICALIIGGLSLRLLPPYKSNRALRIQ
jgi:hypothetical protein